ncbi:hypothetical protein D3C73_1207430 [compost metagenome]
MKCLLCRNHILLDLLFCTRSNSFSFLLSFSFSRFYSSYSLFLCSLHDIFCLSSRFFKELLDVLFSTRSLLFSLMCSFCTSFDLILPLIDNPNEYRVDKLPKYYDQNQESNNLQNKQLPVDTE